MKGQIRKTFLRAKNAKLMLKESKLSILEVAIEVCFQNQSSFSRTYKDLFSRAPSQDRLQRYSLYPLYR
jgi:transcriptional regulator GlxA family with amidase domain